VFVTFIRPVLLRMALEAAFGILAPATNSVPLAIGGAFAASGSRSLHPVASAGRYGLGLT
jgi:hypothetical protein